jgi:hypothetical protein
MRAVALGVVVQFQKFGSRKDMCFCGGQQQTNNFAMYVFNLEIFLFLH